MQPAGSEAIREWYISARQMVKGCGMIEMRLACGMRNGSSLRADGREISVNRRIFGGMRGIRRVVDNSRASSI
ncbi:hypothetical protein [Bradyrhizobium forestalis]|uniref:hypothetical protein n=1 Tax=Bradyrhizobium forestalis TaxID=1419263 RepID=UPI001303FA7B|nr:hypothetical protein [Bradyrhizobium forestalis]